MTPGNGQPARGPPPSLLRVPRVGVSGSRPGAGHLRPSPAGAGGPGTRSHLGDPLACPMGGGVPKGTWGRAGGQGGDRACCHSEGHTSWAVGWRGMAPPIQNTLPLGLPPKKSQSLAPFLGAWVQGGPWHVGAAPAPRCGAPQGCHTERGSPHSPPEGAGCPQKPPRR
uniref:Uncharacterized protein n=1 Tax=Anas platyrhynchos TaxID=8839 RepID=A0A8B9SJS9_ANAPL